MSADTLTDAEAAHLRSVRDDLGLPWDPRVSTRLYKRGLLDMPTHRGGFILTPDGVAFLEAYDAR